MNAGYEASATRLIGVPAERLYDEASRLAPDLVIHSRTPHSSLGASFRDEPVRIDLRESGPDQGRISIQHGQLGTEEEALQMRVFWQQRLADLKARLEP